jgi:UDP:flavonoid glycosyltransferase YjiC (YdhE family)
VRVLAACSLGGAGHLGPLLPLLAAARRRGDETLVVGPPALAELVESTGYRFRAGAEPPEEQVAPIRERLATAPRREASILGNRELFGRLAARAMLPALAAVCDDWRPDLILRDPCEYASAIVAAERGIPVAQVGISLAEVEEGAIEVAAPALEELRPGLPAELLHCTYLTRFPESLDPSPFPATVRLREPRAERLEPLPDWWGGSDAPLVYLTFGTVLGHMSIAAEAYRRLVAAVAGLDVRGLLTVGRRFDPAALGAVPGNVHVERWVEQERVLAEAELVVCHGGSGSALGALASGVPLVLVPRFADQFENGRRIAAAGAGVVAEPDGIRQAIEAVLADPSYRRRAESVAAEMAAAPAVDEALADLGRGA